MASEQLTEKSARQTEHIEAAEEGDMKQSDAALDAATRGQVVTGYETLTVWETIKAFKLCTFVCFAMAFSAATDGYQIGFVNMISFMRNGITVLYTDA